MMTELKIGVLSDIHSNYQAFKACVSYMKEQGISEYILLGDYISDTADAVETMELLYQLMRENDVSILRGNREEYLLDQWYIRNGKKEGIHWIANSASGNLLYTYEKIKEEDFLFFDKLPITFRYEKHGFPAITCCHGSPENARELMELYGANTRDWMQRIDTEYLLAAHTHFPGELYDKGKRYFNPGSVGVSIGDQGHAQCMILHGIERNGVKKWKPEFLKIPYDYLTTVKHMKEKGLLDMAPWFVNSNIHILQTGDDFSARIVEMAANLAADQTNGEAKWPYIDEIYFAKAAEYYGVPDYRE